MKKIKLENKIVKTVAMILPLVLVIVFIEVILRFVGPKYYKFGNASQEYYSNPRGYHIPIRQQDGQIIYGLHYQASVQGYRLPDDRSQAVISEKSFQKSLLVLGDSFTFGRGVKYNDIYSTKLFEMLRKNCYGYFVKNCGRVGADIWDIREIYLHETASQKYPLVVYGFVLNDFGLSMSVSGSDFIDINNGGNRWMPIREVSKIVNLVMFCIEKYRLSQITKQAYLDAFRGERFREGTELLLEINQRIKSDGGVLVVVIFPLLYDFDNYPFKEIHEKMISVCTKANIPVLDLLPIYSRYHDSDLWANPTDQHPNEIAHRIAAENLYNFLIAHKLVHR